MGWHAMCCHLKAFIQVLFFMEYFVLAGHSGEELWALESSIILQQMESADGATFHLPYPAIQSCQQNGEAFIDDASLWTLQLRILVSHLVNMMCKTTQCWECLLFATSGALNLLKCYWYGLHQWTFNDSGGPKLSKINDKMIGD